MNVRVLGLLVAVMTLGAGCGKAPGPVDPQKDAGPGVDADAGSDPDAGAPADAGEPDAGLPPPDAGTLDAGPACDRTATCSVAWTEPAHYPVVVDHHTSFVHSSSAGTYLYVVGGVSNSGDVIHAIYDTLRRAKIAADGSLGAWENAGTLPLQLGFHTQAKARNHVYLIAGASMDAMGPFASGKVVVGTIDNDGNVTWKLGSPLTEADIHGTAAILGDKLYLIGGTASAPKAKVMVSTLGADGVNGAWSTSPVSLPQPRSHHAALVHEGRIFLFGGFDENLSPLDEVLRSEHDASGALTGWVVAGNLPSAPWTAAVSQWGESVFVIGGGEGGASNEHFVDRVRRARFYENNTLQPFVDVTPLPVARSHVHFAPIHEGRIYSVGGRLMPSANSMDRVFIGAFEP